ncbi:MAG TPA: metal ABC transporter substrate-binding protein [Burkholderiaceae bacterium]|nr:metal ABC transporter substrate-binding protein [Burkholderiaceae bacterium]
MHPPRRRRPAGPLIASWRAGRQAVFVVSALLAIVLPLAAARAQAPLRVAATSTDLKALVEAVGGDRVEVDSLAAPDQDPHAIEVKPAQLARLRGAALLVRVGLDNEPWLARLKTEAAVVDVSTRVALLQAQTPRLRAERVAHVHAYGNPHYWLDPANAWPITEAILEALVRLRPADQARFVTNRAAFLEALERRMAEWARMLQPFRGAKLVVIHDSWAYFAERYGLDIVAAAEPTPGVPPSPAELAALVQRMRESGVRIVLADAHAHPSLVQALAARSGARVVTMQPSVPAAGPARGDYIAFIDDNVRRLAEALAAR